MDNKSTSVRLLFTRIGGVIGILLLISALGGCIDGESKLGVGSSDQNTSGDNLTLTGKENEMGAGLPDGNISVNSLTKTKSASNKSEPNQIRLILNQKQFQKTGKLPVTVKIINPRMNETVLTAFRPEFGSEWYNKARVTRINNGSWTKSFSIKPKGNTSYVHIFVQVSENNTVVKRAAWNVTFDTPVGRPN